ncbi:hypothetical protein [Nocardia aurantia]|uniref:Uncharacterized protein n=1 Tax=Nocardia aurantia TaxID=2585199 RepID=A0A7K0DTR4_9NOCA|nr:hypothetical protein [Nocardia aurantia]MQY28978.1 hypothetical protein [Nocardia aurantia]
MPEPGQGPYWSLIVGDHWPQRQWEHLASSVRTAADTFDHGPAEQACRRFDEAVVSSRSLSSIREAMDTRTGDLRELGGALYALTEMLDDFVSITARTRHKILDLYEEAVRRIDTVTAARQRQQASGADRGSGDERADVDAIVDEIRDQVRRVAQSSASAVADAARPHAEQFENLLRRWDPHSTAAPAAAAPAAADPSAGGPSGASAQAPATAGTPFDAASPGAAAAPADAGASTSDATVAPPEVTAPTFDTTVAPPEVAAPGDTAAPGDSVFPGGRTDFDATSIPADPGAAATAVGPIAATADPGGAAYAAGPGAAAVSAGSAMASPTAGLSGLAGLESAAAGAMAGLGAASNATMGASRRERSRGGVAGADTRAGVAGFDGVVTPDPADGPGDADLVGGAVSTPDSAAAQVFSPLSTNPGTASRGAPDEPSAARRTTADHPEPGKSDATRTRANTDETRTGTGKPDATANRRADSADRRATADRPDPGKPDAMRPRADSDETRTGAGKSDATRGDRRTDAERAPTAKRSATSTSHLPEFGSEQRVGGGQGAPGHRSGAPGPDAGRAAPAERAPDAGNRSGARLSVTAPEQRRAGGGHRDAAPDRPGVGVAPTEDRRAGSGGRVSAGERSGSRRTNVSWVAAAGRKDMADKDSGDDGPVTPWTRPVTVDPRLRDSPDEPGERKRAMPEQWAPPATHTGPSHDTPPRPAPERDGRDLSAVGAEADRDAQSSRNR